jgi:3-(3-hydroxy-phenyl)propionate hydroxylase
MPGLETGLLSGTSAGGRGALFPQPRLADGQLMDERYGCGWRLVLGRGSGTVGAMPPALTLIDLGAAAEAEAVVEQWMRRHQCVAALVRPDHYVYGTAADAAALAALLDDWQNRLGSPIDVSPGAVRTAESNDRFR